MLIKPTKAASKRTKERIKQHGPEFTILDARIVICLNNELGYLLSSDKTDWMGWLPSNEIDMTP